MKARTKNIRKSKTKVHLIWQMITTIIVFIGTTLWLNPETLDLNNLQLFVVSNGSSFLISHFLASPCVFALVWKYLK